VARRGQWPKGVSGNPAGLWRKGASANPGGRPKGIGWVREIARGYTKLAIDTLVELCEKGKTESVRRAAVADLLERGWGKPLLQVEVTRTPFDEMSADELRALERALANLEREEAGTAGEPSGTPGAAPPQRPSPVH
jgi:hypothetical protein